jgi:hypothetical protein
MTCRHLLILIAIAFVIVHVSADAVNTSNTTAVPTTNETTLETTVTTQVPTTNATMVTANATTVVPTTTAASTTTVPTTNATTVLTTTPTTQVTAGDISVASSPLGAAILVDGVYYGTTPGNVTGLSLGIHMVRLSLSGYNDYEGTVYIVAGQIIPVYGTLHPISGGASQIILATASVPSTTAVPETTVQPLATQTSSRSSQP